MRIKGTIFLIFLCFFVFFIIGCEKQKKGELNTFSMLKAGGGGIGKLLLPSSQEDSDYCAKHKKQEDAKYYDPYDVYDYDDPDDFADDLWEEFDDESEEDGYDDAYDYWMEKHGK